MTQQIQVDTRQRHAQDITYQAHQCLSNLSAAFETQQLKKTPLLNRLYQDLTQALSDYELSGCDLSKYELSEYKNNLNENRLNKSSQPEQLEKKHHLQWLCNQGKYYLTQKGINSQPRKNRALWQLKATTRAIARFRLIVHLRNLLPGKAPKTIEWRDILPGFKL
ncbi:MAG: hypothetical protein AAFQ63_05955 [Cyanobacteria bacterium J06621_11]